MGLDKDTDETFETEMTRRDNPFRAYLTIIEGCDKACSYCIVPFTSRTRTAASSSRIDSGRSSQAGRHRLFGNSASWTDREFLLGPIAKANPVLPELLGRRGRRFLQDSACAFHNVVPPQGEASGRTSLRPLNSVPGTLCNHIHLPVQSGSTRILRAMRRTYSREQYIEKDCTHDPRSARCPISITSDGHHCRVSWRNRSGFCRKL